jgi:hypothetical protein
MLTRAGSTASGVDTMYRLNKIECPLYHNPPGDSNGGLGPFLNDVTRMRIVGSVEFNAFTYNIRTKSDWIYTPTVFRHYTMNQVTRSTATALGSCCSTVMVFSAHTPCPGRTFQREHCFLSCVSVDNSF